MSIFSVRFQRHNDEPIREVRLGAYYTAVPALLVEARDSSTPPMKLTHPVTYLIDLDFAMKFVEKNFVPITDYTILEILKNGHCAFSYLGSETE